MHHQHRAYSPFDDASSRMPGEGMPGRFGALLTYDEQIKAGTVFDDNLGGKALDNPCLRFDLLLRQRLCQPAQLGEASGPKLPHQVFGGAQVGSG